MGAGVPREQSTYQIQINVVNKLHRTLRSKLLQIRRNKMHAQVTLDITSEQDIVLQKTRTLLRCYTSSLESVGGQGQPDGVNRQQWSTNCD